MSEKAYPELKATDRVKEECGKCMGTGSVEWGANVNGVIYTGKQARVISRVCFDCNGLGYRMILVSSIRARETLAKKRAAEAAAKIAEAAARYATWKAENADLAEAVAELAKRGDHFAKDVEGRVLSEAQASVIWRKVDERISAEAQKAAAEPVPTGRVEVTGEILSVKSQDSMYGVNYKMLLVDDRGFKVYGNMPKALTEIFYGEWYDGVVAAGYSTRDYGPDCWLDTAKHRKVTFVATLEPSNDDPKFGFFSRANKATTV